MKKIILPAIFAFLYIVFIFLYIFTVLVSTTPIILKVLIGGLLFATAPLMVYVFIQRYKELKKEEKDDFSQY